jgi:hypothetical protein
MKDIKETVEGGAPSEFTAGDITIQMLKKRISVPYGMVEGLLRRGFVAETIQGEYRIKFMAHKAIAETRRRVAEENKQGYEAARLLVEMPHYSYGLNF